MASPDITEPSVYIYVMGAECRPVKVGYSLYPEARLEALRKHSPDDLKLIYSAECRHAERLFAERYAHAILWPRRVRGERFDVTPEQAITAVECAVAGTKAGKLPPGMTETETHTPLTGRRLRRPGLFDALGRSASREEISGLLAYRDAYDRAQAGATFARNSRSGRDDIERLALIHEGIERDFCKAVVTLFVRVVGGDERIRDLPGSGRQGKFMQDTIKRVAPHILCLTADASQDRGISYPSAGVAQAA